MRVCALLCLVIGLTVTPAFAQDASATWQRVVPVAGDRGEVNAMALTGSGNIVVGGSLTRAGPFLQGQTKDAWVAAYAPDGTELWSRQFGTEHRDEVAAIVIGPDGAIFATGPHSMILTQGRQSSDSFIVKFDETGELQWQTVVGDGVARRWTTTLGVTPDGGVLASGTETLQGDGGTQPFVVKLAADGTLAWQAVVPTPADTTGGVVVVRSDGRAFAFDSAEVGAMRGADRVEILFDRSGFEGTFNAGCVVVSLRDGKPASDACAENAREGFQPGRHFHSAMTADYATSDVKITKYAANGSVVWQRQPKTPWGDGINAVAAMPDGGVVGAGFRLTSGEVGRHNWDGLLVRFDAAGELLWSKQFGGNKRDEFNGVGVLADGSIVVAGYSGSQPGAPDWAPWIMRLNAEGELEGAALEQIQERQF